MCLPIAGAAAGSAAAISATTSIIGTITSVFGTVAGIAQAQQSAQMQAAQAQQQIDMQQRQQQEAAQLANKRTMADYAGRSRAAKESRLAFERNFKNVNEAANKSYVQEQVKLQEKKDAAAFKSQEILAKSIGMQGSVLAAGQSGQSVGLLVSDAERQAGFALAQENATIRSAEKQADVASDVAFSQAKSSANTAFNQLQITPQAPVLDPYGMKGLEMPEWSFA
tara:strand:+ start:278 stop:949 length:672 start_codon:yes stop_codon:yes gene_type:complete